jgi:AraC family transcriptional regulator
MCNAMPANSHVLPGIHSHARRTGSPPRIGLALWQQGVLATYIEKHLAESIRIRALASFVYLNSCNFCRAFKKSFGISPHRYLIHRRVERAKALLIDPTWSVTEIGRALGFRQTRSFSAAFRNLTGTTPAEYRRALRWSCVLAEKETY